MTHFEKITELYKIGKEDQRMYMKVKETFYGCLLIGTPEALKIADECQVLMSEIIAHLKGINDEIETLNKAAAVM